MQNKTLLRTQLRAKRRSLSPKQQRVAAKKLSFRISQSIAFKKAKNIAFYFANDGEICLKDTIKLAMKHRKRCFAPVVTRKTLNFKEIFYFRKFVLNKFGIPEPNARANTIPAHKIDLVLLPLVGFDLVGNRLGMGGGFYDQTFAFVNKKSVGTCKLMGTAHECQRLTQLCPDPWDIPLHYVATESRLLKLND